MKCLLRCLLTISLCGALAAQSSSPENRPITDPKATSSMSNPAARPVPIDDLYYTRAVYDPAWSPDGKQIVLVSDMSGRLNLWRVNSSGSWPIQLTQSDDRQFSPAWSPDGKWIVYQQDTAGNELWDLFAVPSDGGDIVNLTNTPDAREESPLWSADGSTLAFTIGRRNQPSPILNCSIGRAGKFADSRTKPRKPIPGVRSHGPVTANTCLPTAPR